VKVQAVVALKADYRLALVLEVAGLARSTYFYHQARQHRPDAQAALKTAIRTAFAQAHGRYGHRRIQASLVVKGWRVAKKTVLALMRQLGLVCQVRRRRGYRSYRGAVGKTAPNRLDRDFRASAPNQKWVTDVTEFAVGADKLYLAAILDLFDRQIVAYTIGVAPNLGLTNRTLQAALATLEPGQTPLVHSDQGAPYQHASWRALLAGVGATASMSRKGTCLDNAVMENFFSHLKAECTRRRRFASVGELHQALQDYLAWYNTDRISTTLNNLSPMHYRAYALAA
jgi:putative transposase